MIRLEPYQGDSPVAVAVLLEEMQMNVNFDEMTDCDTCYFCFQADEASPMVDYEIAWDVLETWHAGNVPVELRELSHDPERFAVDMAVMA